MGWQEALMLLGGAAFISAVIYMVRRKKAASSEDGYEDPEEAARRAELARELPNTSIDGEAVSAQRGLDPLFDDIQIFDDDPIPVLRNKQQPTAESLQAAFEGKLDPAQVAEFSSSEDETSDEELAWAKMRRMFSVDPAFAKASRSSIEEQQKELQELQEKKHTLVKEQQEKERKAKELLAQQALAAQYLEEQSNQEVKESYNDDDLVEWHHPSSEGRNLKQPTEALESQLEDTLSQELNGSDSLEQGLEQSLEDQYLAEQLLEEQYLEDQLVEGQSLNEQSLQSEQQLGQPVEVAEIDPEEREKNLRTALLANLEKNAWGSSEVFLTINVNAPSEQPFIGNHLSQFMDMIGMKLSNTGFYHYVEEKDGQPYLGFSMVNMFSPGCFSEDMDEDYTTAGVVLVMPLPNTPVPMAIFERMLATAKVMEQNWGAELQDEQRSNLTQQTIEHYRQTIKDFEYQTRVNAKKAGRI